MGDSFYQLLENVPTMGYIGLSHLINLLIVWLVIWSVALECYSTLMPRLLVSLDNLAWAPYSS